VDCVVEDSKKISYVCDNVEYNNELMLEERNAYQNELLTNEEIQPNLQL